MDLQFVFGNPVPGKKTDKKRLASGRKPKQTRTKERAVSKRKKRNPYYWSYHKGKKKERYKGRPFVTMTEHGQAARKKQQLRNLLKNQRLNVGTKKRLGAQIQALDKILRMKDTDRTAAIAERKEALAAGYASGKLKRKPTMARRKKRKHAKKRAAKKSARKRRAKVRHPIKKRHAKRAVSRKRAAKKAAATRRRKHLVRVHAGQKAARKRRRGALRRFRKKHARHAHMKHHIPIPRRKGQAKSFRIGKRRYTITRKNPIGGIMNQFQNWTGQSVQEAGGLALGGAIYGAVNGAAARIPGVSVIQTQLQKVPVVGTSLVPFLIGALLHKLGEKQKIPALQLIGSGLVGASVVGMGVNASAMIPFLRPKTLGSVDYTMQGIPQGIGADADFGETELGAVDYTSMQGIEDGQLTGDEPAMGDGADFGEGADFGGIPEGLSGFGLG
jgi:hypothetical protein